MQTARARLMLAGGICLLVVVALMLWWRSDTPPALAADDETVNATTPVGRPIYLGVYATGPDFGRTLHVSGVKIHATSNTDVSLTPLLCRGGAITVTTAPENFCPVLVDPAGQELRAGDQVVLQVISDEPAVAVVDPVRIAFRENLRWATLPAGSGAIVRVIAG